MEEFNFMHVRGELIRSMVPLPDEGRAQFDKRVSQAARDLQIAYHARLEQVRLERERRREEYYAERERRYAIPVQKPMTVRQERLDSKQVKLNRAKERFTRHDS
jgi:hypothetical protein